ncbi:MAG: tRNA pseudouridine(38-40) synthase TruA [Bacteroidota bacterium]|nr:tRNA pseudouridine(38-40) synthase TruA [Bacteroidota bacterium]
MKRYFIQLAYNGANYVGWQIQPNGLSVQESLEKALSVILSEKIKVIGAGRTDAGVHARFFIAHFNSTRPIEDTEKLTYSLNNYLAHDISVQKIFRVNVNAHARFDAISRTYEYWIVRHKDPFLKEFAYKLPHQLKLEIMNSAAQLLFNYTDFTSFSKLHTDVKTNNCKIIKAGWAYRNDVLVFTIGADRFLRNMVRAIVGTLLDVGRGRIDLDDFCEIIEKKDRSLAGFSVPAHGLYLTGIEYGDLEGVRER